MPCLRTEDAFNSTATIISTSCTTTTTTKSLFALALQALSLSVFLVVVVALLLFYTAAILILLPVVCMAASVCLLCATTARLLAPSSVRPARAGENRHGVRAQRQDCVEVVDDRAEAPAGGFGDGGAASSAEEEHGEQEQGRCFSFSSFEEDFSGSWDDDDEQGRLFFVDTRSYCRTFYDLLAFWRSMERRATRGDRNVQYMR